MPFLTRWDDDHSRPAFTSALRDVFVRAVLPAVVLFGVIVGFGFMLKGPLEPFSEWENNVNRWFQDGRTEAGETITNFMSMIGNTEYVIAVAVIVSARRVVAHQGVVVRRRAAASRSRCRPPCSSSPPRWSSARGRPSSGSTPPRRRRASPAGTSGRRPRCTSRSR